jgi:hypothetical protein
VSGVIRVTEGLLPCPACLSANVHVWREEDDDYWQGECLSVPCQFRTASVEGREAAVVAWNTRVAPQPPADYARLAARVGELERERDAARAELEEVLSILGLSGSDPDVCCCGSMISGRTCHTAGHSPRSMREYALTSMVEQASALAAKLAQHREALKPFSEMADAAFGEADELLVPMRLGDCRRARDVMEAGR